MEEETIKYKSGFRHQLCDDHAVDVRIYPQRSVVTDYIAIYTLGRLVIGKGYAWDGPSGPCRWLADRLPEFIKRTYLRTILRGSLVHDALYQLIRLGLLPASYREAADNVLREICLRDGMTRARAWWVYKAVRKCGAAAADPENKRKILTAP